MKRSHLRIPVLIIVVALALSACDRLGGKLTVANYNKITVGMSKAQVERILGPPTTSEKVDMFIFKKTTYRYEDGKKFVIVTFKNDELDSKDTNLNASP